MQNLPKVGSSLPRQVDKISGGFIRTGDPCIQFKMAVQNVLSYSCCETSLVFFCLTLDKHYRTYDEISEALINGDVTGALIDTYVLGSRKDLFERLSLRVIKIYDYSTVYGMVLGGESRKLKKCFRRYIQRHKRKIFQAIEKHVEYVEVRRIVNIGSQEVHVSAASVCIQDLLLLAYIM